MLTKALLPVHLFDCFIVMDAICHDHLQLITIIGTALPLDRPPLNKVARGGYLSCFVPPKLYHYRSTRRHDPCALLENSTGQKLKMRNTATPSSMALIGGKYFMRHLHM